MMFSELCLEYFTSLVIILAAVFLLFWKFTSRPSGIPPGPPVYFPGLGHFVEMARGDMRDRLREWRKRYGDVFSLYFGNQLVIVFNGYDTLKEAFVKNGDVFSDRPKMFLFEKLNMGKGIGSTNGHLWKEQRAFTISTLRDFGFGKRSLEDKIQEEVRVLLSETVKTDGQPYSVKKLINTSFANVICSIVFDVHFQHGDSKFQEFANAVEQFMELTSANGIVNFLPFLQFLPGDIFKINNALENKDKINNFVKEKVREHIQTYDENNIRDFIGAYLKKMKDCERSDVNSSFNEESLVGILMDLFAAGTETSATTMEWLLAYTMNYPYMQERIHEELDSYVGRDRLPLLRDKPKLPFTEAFILEVMRHSALAQISIPRATARDVEFRGYRIPQGVPIIPVYESVLFDPNLWDSPKEFRPERFFSTEGNVHNREHHIAFSMGRRMCPGDSLAKMELFLFFTAMLQRFNFLPPEGEQPPTLDGILGLTYKPKPFKLRAVVRA